MPGPDRAAEEAERAAAEAAGIGGRVNSEPPGSDERPDEAARPLAEAGQGEAEGFEQAEEELIERSSHGDQHAARRVLGDAPTEAEDRRAASAGDADEERSSEREEETP